MNGFEHLYPFPYSELRRKVAVNIPVSGPVPYNTDQEDFVFYGRDGEVTSLHLN